MILLAAIAIVVLGFAVAALLDAYLSRPVRLDRDYDEAPLWRTKR